MLQLKRAYLPASNSDGYRILVDRLWPRGKSKETEKIDLWLKEIAPSPELRKWFNHEDTKYPEFQRRYQEELQTGAAKKALETLQEVLAKEENVTLVYGAKNETHNNASVLYDILTK
ncbi:DUF488 domain-containing protein [Enterococcus dongliensis]|uniref:DUF488 domain-containing protein n=1 Tax=Enterococcus dongliensis TaxID=2559925 RepID=UPI00288FA14A|nr:DUF488 domain-containing protein [Enterococcus dongliensis]MDT2614106.1 DUF488 domain-containing protein [Enterococcus dongliensis]